MEELWSYMGRAQDIDAVCAQEMTQAEYSARYEAAKRVGMCRTGAAGSAACAAAGWCPAACR